MKKHFLYVSTAALLAMSFASCVDNDEPRGLRELRYAKANEWNANADWKRATIYGDSLLHLFTAQAQDLANKSVELDNLKKQADNNYKIEKQNYQLALDKARIDLKLAQAKDSLARENESNEKALEQFKIDLINKQIAVKKAQEKLDDFEARQKTHKDSLNAVITKKQAEFARQLADAQDLLNRNKLHADSLAAQLEASTYETNLNCLLIVAAAHKDAWDANKNKVYDAYSNLNAKQKAMRDKELALFKAQQNLIFALNKYEEDSATAHKALKDSINDAQYALDWASKKVTLAENVLADFEENSKANKETWTKKYNEYKAAIDALANEIDEYDVQIADAKATKSADSLKYVNAKKEIEKPLKNYNDQANYHTFILADAIAADTTFKLPKEAKHFELKQGVIANADTIKNSDLNAELDAILNKIGNDEKGSGTFYYNDKDIKLAKEAIAKFQKDTADLYDALDKKIAEYNGKINDKKSDNITKQQELDEYKALTNIKDRYTKEKKAFEDAVTAYKKAALDYEFSEKNNSKSDIYERFANELAAAIKDFNVAYKAELDKADGDVYSPSMIKKRKDIQTLAKTGSETNNTNKYWDLRKVFDGTTWYKDVKNEDAQKFWNFGTNLSETYGTTAWDNTGSEVAVFDGYIKVDVDNIKDEDIDGKVKVILSGNNTGSNAGNVRASGNDKGENINTWQTYVDATTAFMGSDQVGKKYEVFKEDQIRNLKKDNETDYKKLATTYDYWEWMFTIETLEKGIADNLSDPEQYDEDDTSTPPTYKKGDYKNPGIAEYKVLITKAEEQTAEDVAKKVEKIDSVQTKIDNSPKWKKLYDDIKKVKDANDAKIKELTIAQQEAYKTDLSTYEALVVADKKKVDDLQLKQDIAKSDTTYKAKAMKAYKKLVLQNTDTTGSASDARLADADIAAEIIIEYTTINLQYAIDQAKEEKAKAKMDLDNATKHLTDFEAGERDWNRNNYVATVNAKQQLITEAELQYEHATKEYDVALKYYNDVLAAIEEEE